MRLPSDERREEHSTLGYRRESNRASRVHAPMVLILHPFRFLDPVTHKWVKARYVAERDELEARYAKWEIIGEPEMRGPLGGSFNAPSLLVLASALERARSRRRALYVVRSVQINVLVK